MKKATRGTMEYCEKCRKEPWPVAKVGNSFKMKQVARVGGEAWGLAYLSDFGLGVKYSHCFCGAPLPEIPPGHCQECRRLIYPIIERDDNEWYEAIDGKYYELPLINDLESEPVRLSPEKEYLLGWKTGWQGFRNRHLCFCDVGPLLRELDRLVAKQRTPLMKFLHGLIDGLQWPVTLRRPVQDPER